MKMPLPRSVYKMRWIEVESYSQMSRLAADLFRQQLMQKPDSVLGLATGRSPEGFYQELVNHYKQGDISFKRAITFNLDEYVGLAPEQKSSYHFYMKTRLFSHVDLPDEHQNLPNGLASDLNLECGRYEELISGSGGIDLQLLGIGANGHIGFNEPGTSFQSRTHVVKLTEATRNKNANYFSSIDEVPSCAITMGIKTIMEADRIILLAFGREKREAVERLKLGQISEEFPASVLNCHPNVMVLHGE